MKRFASISLLALLLYNAFGYYLLFAYEREQARVMALQDMPESAFQVLKFNLAIYTSVQNTDFEYVNEELLVEGKTYNIVKKRVQNDTLQMFYLRNFRQDELRQNLNEIVENQTLSNHSTDNSPIKQLLKSFIKDYIPQGTFLLLFEPNNLTTEGVVLTATFKRYKDSDYVYLHSPPPEA
jgi:type II secretory ATPase GspE/PulE/Tfp pilus assembly ATPase PilB-like protein